MSNSIIASFKNTIYSNWLPFCANPKVYVKLYFIAQKSNGISKRMYFYYRNDIIVVY